jgi:hypothetical protein
MLSAKSASLLGRAASRWASKSRHAAATTEARISTLASPIQATAARRSWLQRVLPSLIALGAAATFATLASEAKAKDEKQKLPQAPITVTGKSVSYPENGRVIFVGDVHGCAGELTDLLNAVSFDEDDLLVLVGDLIGKGPDSEGVVRLARGLGPQCLAVRGNHDQVILDWYYGLSGTLPALPVSPQPGAHAAAATPAASSSSSSAPSAEAFEAMPKQVSSHKECAQRLTADDWAWFADLPVFLHFPDANIIGLHGGLLPGGSLWQTPPRSVLNVRAVAPEKDFAALLRAPLPAESAGGADSNGSDAGNGDGSSSSGGEDTPVAQGVSAQHGGDYAPTPLFRGHRGGALWASVYSGIHTPTVADPNTDIDTGAYASAGAGAVASEAAAVLRALLRTLPVDIPVPALATAGAAADAAAAGADADTDSVLAAGADWAPLLPTPLLPTPLLSAPLVPGSSAERTLLFGGPNSLLATLADVSSDDVNSGDGPSPAARVFANTDAEGAIVECRDVVPPSPILAAAAMGGGASYVAALGGAARPHVIFGHDAVQGLQAYPYATGLETGVCYGRRLSALVFPPRREWAGRLQAARAQKRRVWSEAADALGRGAVAAAAARSPAEAVAAAVGSAAAALPVVVAHSARTPEDGAFRLSVAGDAAARAGVPPVVTQVFEAELTPGVASHHPLAPALVQVRARRMYTVPGEKAE